MKKIYWISMSLGFLMILGFQEAHTRENSLRISYIREVENYLHLSDFQLGSNERIRDQDGHGVAIGWLFFDEGFSFFELDFGISGTKYKGTIEDGVNVDFTPQEGSGFEALSESNNIFYEVDLQFQNPYIGISYTNWRIVAESFRAKFVLPATYAIGVIFQNAKGDVLIRSIDGTEIAKASYRSNIQAYLGLGWSFHLEDFYFSFLFRRVTSPVLEIESCNEIAIGDLACKRVESATGNRNNSLQIFTGGLLTVGILF